MGAIEINDFSGVRKLAVDTLQLLPKSILMRRGRRLRSMANSTVLVPLVQITTWGGRTCHCDEGEGLNLKHEVPTRPMKGQELHLGSGGPHQGPGGAVSGTLSTGLGLTISLDPAVGDLLAEPKPLRKGTN